MVTLVCVLVGEAGSAFPVDIDASQLVGHLKKAIKGEKPSTITCDADNLKLYLAKKGDGTWLGSTTEDAKMLKKGEKTALLEALTDEDNELEAEFGLEEVLGRMPTPETKQIHVLVVAPRPKRRRVDETTLPVAVPPPERFEPGLPPVIGEVNYSAMSAALLRKCGLKAPAAGDVMLYCRSEVRDLWDFLHDEVIAQNATGFVVGPPGTGKSLATLCYLAHLDRNEWNVVWIHIGDLGISCLSMGGHEYWDSIDDMTFVAPRVTGKRLLVCLDGYKGLAHRNFLWRIRRGLTRDERLVVCSSMATQGKLNWDDANVQDLRLFHMFSWTRDEYDAAVADAAFYGQVVPKLDAPTTVNEVNDESAEDGEESEADTKKNALDRKFYFAGGSCRFMFQYTTEEVKARLEHAMKCVVNKADLIRYCCGELHHDTINTLYGLEDSESVRLPVSEGARLPVSRGTRFPVSSYVASLFVKQVDEDTIATLASELNTSDNPAIDGHLLEWRFFAAVPNRKVKLVGSDGVVDELPTAAVLPFDPKKRFKVSNERITGNKIWLKPVAWNQGGYDAVYVDQDKGNVIFIQVTRSRTHSFKMRFFNEVLLKLRWAKMAFKSVEVYFVVKPEQCLKFTIGHVEDHDLLRQFDASWTGPEEKHVKVRAFKSAHRHY